MPDLPPEGFGEFLHTLKAQGDVPAGRGPVNRTEQIIPQSQGDAEIDPVAFVLRDVLGMVPDVHFR